MLLVALTTIVASGLFAGNRGGEPLGPLAHLVSADIARFAKDVHESTWGILQLLIIVHLGGVFTHWALKGENLVRSMWTGNKTLTAGALGDDGKIVPLWRAVVLIAIAGVLVWVLMTLA